jgi:hypothetical protein
MSFALYFHRNVGPIFAIDLGAFSVRLAVNVSLLTFLRDSFHGLQSFNIHCCMEMGADGTILRHLDAIVACIYTRSFQNSSFLHEFSQNLKEKRTIPNQVTLAALLLVSLSDFDSKICYKTLSFYLCLQMQILFWSLDRPLTLLRNSTLYMLT